MIDTDDDGAALGELFGQPGLRAEAAAHAMAEQHDGVFAGRDSGTHQGIDAVEDGPFGENDRLAATGTGIPDPAFGSFSVMREVEFKKPEPGWSRLGGGQGRGGEGQGEGECCGVHVKSPGY